MLDTWLKKWGAGWGCYGNQLTKRNCPPWPGKTVAIAWVILTTGGPGKAQGAKKLPPTGRIRERSQGDRRHQSVCPTSLPESLLESILLDACTTRKDSESEWGARDSQETNPIPGKPGTASHVAEQFWVPSPSCSPPFPIKSLALLFYVDLLLARVEGKILESKN